jgi:hypothetical protein
MTAIAIWCNHEIPQHPALWVAADSRVTNGDQILVEDAAKVMSLPVICRKPDERGLFTDIYHMHAVGYCFAGNTLMGQNAYLGLAPLLSNLISVDGYIPSMLDIARHALLFLSQTFDKYKERVGERAVFETALFGFCHREKKLSVYHFRPEIIDGIARMTIVSHEGMAADDFVYLGDDATNMRESIAQAFLEDAGVGGMRSRTPRYVIQRRIDDDDSLTIGGDIQLGIADALGFRPFCTWTIRGPGPGQGQGCRRYLGWELTDDLECVGEARVELAGFMA